MLFSIIVPVYNIRESYLRECLESILVQEFDDFEAILVDDGSTNGCGSILDEYALKDKRLKVIHKENGGVVSARTAGAEAAVGKYITCLDSDDILAENFALRMVQLIQETDAELYCCGHIRLENGGQGPRKVTGLRGGDGLFTREDIESLLLPNLKRFRATLWGIFIPREMYIRFQKQMSTRVVSGEDSVMIYAILAEAQSVMMITDKLYYYRVHDESTVHRANRFLQWESPMLRFRYLEQNLPMDKCNLRGQTDAFAVWSYFKVAISRYGNMGYFAATKDILKNLKNPEIDAYIQRKPNTNRKEIRLVRFMLKYRLLLLVKLYQVCVEMHKPFWQKFFPKLK